ncbi:hypothetical protein KGM_202621 [Danaus plexippus plexippus]|uniref:Uncharacterized protein n=1 Tax=Danaus plexippus plexippus TaxID=278856 RepID=A0A212EIW7_DANPL|nr:hypothetical protein KGM_202621 [Danaus plexippus plexippus]
MGNSKSKKMKITQSDGQQTNDNRERINTIKTETNDVDLTKKNIEGDSNNEQIEEKSNDNASSASTVEVLDDK